MACVRVYICVWRTTDFDERVLPSIVNEVTKAVVARYNASELLTKRDQVSRAIRDQLTARSKDFHILLDDVSITHLAFSKEYTAAVEAKQVGTCENCRNLVFAVVMRSILMSNLCWHWLTINSSAGG